MTRIWIILVTASAIATLVPEQAVAQTRTSDQIATDWRNAKRVELRDQRDAINEQIRTLDDRATPDEEPRRQYTIEVPPSSPPIPPVPGPRSELAASTTVEASGTPPPPPHAPAPAPPTAKSIAEAIKALDKKPGGTFGGIDFGGGISFTLDIGTSDRISDATLVDGIVRVNDENNGRARIMLESHFFFTPNGDLDWLDLDNTSSSKQWGWGPFIALQPGTDDVIEAVGMGVMFGARRGEGNESFNLGFGFVVDPNTRILGEGLTVNRPLPAGETAIRYKEEMQTGILILSSFSF